MTCVQLAVSSSLSDDAATVCAKKLNMEIDSRNSEASMTTLADGTVLVRTGTETDMQSLVGDTEVYTLTLNNIDSVLISGESLNFVLTDNDMKAVASDGREWVALTLSDSLTRDGAEVPQALMVGSQLNVTLNMDSDSYTGFYRQDSSGNVGTVYFRMTPEPTTGALCLLALAGLAARRRRK